MAMLTIIAPTTSSVSVTPVDTSNFDHVVLVAYQLGGAEVVSVYIQAIANDGSLTFIPYVDSSGTAVTLTTTKTALTLTGGVIYGVVKPTTASPCGIVIHAGNFTG